MIARGKRYRLKANTIAVVPQGAKGIAQMIPEGSIVEVTDVRIEGSRSVNINWDGKVCQMFTQDLRERGEEVKAPGPLPF